MAAGDWVTLAVIAAAVAAFFLGRRHGRARVATAIANARVEGEASADARAAARASVALDLGGVHVGDVRSMSVTTAEEANEAVRVLVARTVQELLSADASPAIGPAPARADLLGLLSGRVSPDRSPEELPARSRFYAEVEPRELPSI